MVGKILCAFATLLAGTIGVQTAVSMDRPVKNIIVLFLFSFFVLKLYIVKVKYANFKNLKIIMIFWNNDANVAWSEIIAWQHSIKIIVLRTQQPMPAPADFGFGIRFGGQRDAILT